VIATLLWLIHRLTPADLRGWARAMQVEIESLPPGLDRLRFAIGCVAAAFKVRLRAAGARMEPAGSANVDADLLRWQIGTGLAAVAIGLAYLWAAQAPAHYLWINAAAAVAGLLLLSGICATLRLSARLAAVTAVFGAALVLATALFGFTAEGATRWFRAGPLFVQSSFLVLPLVVVLYARFATIGTALGMMGLSLAIALQPDRAMAGALCLAAAAVYLVDRSALRQSVLGATALGFVATVIASDRLPAVPFVDHILWSGFAVHPLTGASLWAGLMLILLPAALRLRQADPAAVSFFGCWVGLIGAAAMGAYPTPLVGYGGSAILGYFLGLAALRPVVLRQRVGGQTAAATSDDLSDFLLRITPKRVTAA
jgi:hypothetical protein